MEKVSCKVTPVHRISPLASDVRQVDLPTSCFSDTRALGKALREAGVLSPGDRVIHFRTQGEKVVAFPSRSIWHSIVIELPVKG